MWIEELQNGKFRAVERYTDPMTGKQKKISVTIDKDTRSARKEAQRILDQKIEDRIGKQEVHELTLKELTSMYVAHLEETVKASTYAAQKPVYGKIKTIIGEDVLVERLTAAYAMQRIRKKTEVPSTINHYITFLRTMFAWAYNAELVNNRLDRLQKVKDDRKSRIEDKYLEPDELEKLLNEIKNEKYKALTRFLALSGLRIGEAIALTMDDLDEYIHVTKTYSRQTKSIMDTPKTATSARDVYIQPELAEFLKQYRRDRLQWQLVEGVRTDLLFFGEKGGHVNYVNYGRALDRASAAIGHRITPHALRHTHVSILAAQGVSYDTIARRLGHAGEGITKQVYLHVTQKLRERDNEAMQDVRIL